MHVQIGIYHNLNIPNLYKLYETFFFASFLFHFLKKSEIMKEKCAKSYLHFTTILPYYQVGTVTSKRNSNLTNIYEYYKSIKRAS